MKLYYHKHQFVPLDKTLEIYFSGCSLRCPNCHNAFLQERTKENCKEVSSSEILEELKDYVDIATQIHILGGEPLCNENIHGVIDVCREFKGVYPNKKIYMWSGYSFEQLNEVQKGVLRYIDILVDGRFEEDKKNLSLRLRGSSNQRIIDVKETLLNNRVIEYMV